MANFFDWFKAKIKFSKAGLNPNSSKSLGTNRCEIDLKSEVTESIVLLNSYSASAETSEILSHF